MSFYTDEQLSMILSAIDLVKNQDDNKPYRYYDSTFEWLEKVVVGLWFGDSVDEFLRYLESDGLA